ncbi:MAG: siderophore-interacting protein [Aliihoeflea sp.]
MPSTQAEIRLANPVIVMEALCEHMAEHEIAITERDDIFVAKLNAAQATMRATAEALSVHAEAETDARLEEIVSFLASHVLEFAHPEMPEIIWSGIAGGRLPADFREMTVLRTCKLMPHMRRITLTGNDLDRFANDGNLHVRLFFPPPGRAPVWPLRGPDGLIQPVAPEQKPQVRKYTLRRIDPVAREVDIDFVIHEVAGPGSDWANFAQAGDLVGMAGPGGRTAKTADWMLLAGDETALPAIARILEGLPASTRGHVVIVSDESSGVTQLSKPTGVDVEWLLRSSVGQSLASRVAEISVPDTGSRFCWAGAEFDDAQAIRRYWRDTCNLNKDEQLAVAYWRRGEASS